MPNFSQMNFACVPLPAPGAPNRINRMVTCSSSFEFLSRQNQLKLN
jgi:hypothetical protein